MKVLFVSGPYRGRERENIAKAAVVAAKLANAGWGVFCPHAHSMPIEALLKKMESEQYLNAPYWLELDLRILEACYGIVMLPGWERSIGARGEYERAKELGIQIYLWSDGYDRGLLLKMKGRRKICGKF